MFVLLAQGGACRGVYDSETSLRFGVDYWKERSPNQTMAFEVWETNKGSGPTMWDWAYIAPNSSHKKLRSGGGNVPDQSFWGQNLICLKWY